MAGWISSKLKEAENFLQQIDQQAAESLGKPEKEKRHGISKNKRGHGNIKPIFDLSLAEPKDVPQETHVRNKLELGSEPLPPPLSKLVKKSDQGPRVVNDQERSERKGPSLYRKKKPDANLQIESNTQNITGKDDWTELLASPHVDLAASPALASSVGSSDSIRAGYSRRLPHKFTPNSNKNGRHHQSDDVLSGNFPRGPNLTLKISPSASSSKIGIVDSQNAFLPGRFGDETLKRRLENDLAGLGGAEAVAENSKVSTSKITDLNHNISNQSRRPLDSDTYIGAVEGRDEFFEDVGVTELKGQQQQSKHSNAVWNQVGRPSSPDHTVHEKYEGSNQMTHRATSEGPFLDDFEEVLELENKGNSMQNASGRKDTSAILDNPLAVDTSELATAPETGESEELPLTRVLPASLQAEEDSYESSSMTNEDSDGGTESEEDEEIERRKSAHKKRIARRKELTAARAAEAQAAITERKIFVEKLEKEVTYLQRVLAERKEQQGREAAELRTTIAEVMQALEAEKKLHSSTRMKALSVESQLENENADLAKSLGALQWELEEEMSQVLKARRMIETKEAVKTDLERRLAKAHGDTCSSQQLGEVKYMAKGEDRSFEEEQSDLWKKIQQCQLQVKDLEVKICDLKDARLVRTDIEKELENRLAQMTDYLIQKQTQVEALSSEKATLLIRLETLTETIEEERVLASSQASRTKHGRRNLHWDFNYYDMEHGLGRSYDSKLKPFAYENGQSSATPTSTISIGFSPIFRQLNGFISAGNFYIRKHRWARVFTVVYIAILHLWFWFVLFMKSEPAQTLALQELGLPKVVSELKNGSNVTNLL